MKVRQVSLILMLALVFMGCAGLTHSTKDLPDWYLNTPEDEFALYGIGESKGDDLGLTRQDAQAAARDEIAQQMEIKISNLITRSKQAVGGKIDIDVIRSTSKQIASLSASHISIVEKKVLTKGKSYVVYALAKMPIESLREQTKKTLEQEEIKRQLDVHGDLQNLLNDEVDKLDGSKEG